MCVPICWVLPQKATAALARTPRQELDPGPPGQGLDDAPSCLNPGPQDRLDAASRCLAEPALAGAQEPGARARNRARYSEVEPEPPGWTPAPNSFPSAQIPFFGESGRSWEPSLGRCHTSWPFWEVAVRTSAIPNAKHPLSISHFLGRTSVNHFTEGNN